MNDIEKTLKAYENDTSAESTIRNAITGAYQNLKPELDLINQYENAQFPSFYGSFNGYGMGTGATDMSPTARLQNAWSEAGRQSTAANTARGVLDVRRAGMEDLIKSAFGQWNMGYTGAQNAWDRDMQLQQLELQKQAAARSGTPGIVIPSPSQPTQPASGIQLIVDDKTGKVVGYSNGYSSNYLPGQNPYAQSSSSTNSPIKRSGYTLPTMPTPVSANTASQALNGIINNFRGIR